MIKNLKIKIKTFISDLKNGRSYSLKHLLNEEIEKNYHVSGIKLRKLIYPLAKVGFQIYAHNNLIIDKEEKLPKGPKVYVVNHFNEDDTQIAGIFQGESAYILFGNDTLLFETTNALKLSLVGMVPVIRDSKESKNLAYKKMNHIIKNGGNVVIWPEGYWNLADDGEKDARHGADSHDSRTWLMQDFYYGPLRLAQENDVPIVPIVLHYDNLKGNNCYAQRLKPFYVRKEDEIKIKKDELRQLMLDTKFFLMEKYSSYKKSDLLKNGISLENEWDKMKEKSTRGQDIERIGYKFSLEEEKLISKAPVLNPVVTPNEAFQNIENLEYDKDNAFLLKKTRHC